MFDGRKFLLTYSQCSLSKEAILTYLQNLKEVRYYTIASEKHQDGRPHIHVAVHFMEKVHTTNVRYFDIEGFHPNVKKLKLARDFTQADEYCRKDNDFISNVTKEVGKRVALAKRLLDHGKLDETFIRDNPEIIFVNFSSLQSYLSLLQPKRRKVDYPLQKKRHYWLHGPSNSGKTYTLREFISEKIAVEIPTNNDWHCDERTEVIYADEYKGSLTVQMLNRLCDGHTQLNKKGGSTNILFPTIVIVSNYSIIDCYKNISNEIYETLCNRFIECLLPNNKPDW